MRRLPFHLTLLSLLLPLVLGSGALLSWIAYRRTSAILAEATSHMLSATAGQLQATIREAIDPQQAAIGLDLVAGLGEGRSLAERLDRLEEARQALERTPHLTAYFIGYPDGQVFFVARARDAAGRPWPGLPAAASLLVESIAPDRVPGGSSEPLSPGSPFWRQQLVLDARLQPLAVGGATQLLPRRFDPRQRPWYQQALASPTPVLSSVLRLALGERLGVILSRRLPGGLGVVGASFELESLEGVLLRHRPTPGSQMAVVNGQALVLASTVPGAVPLLGPGASTDLPQLRALGSPALAALAPGLEGRVGAGFRPLRLAGAPWRTAVLPLPLALPGRPLFLAVAVPDHELLADARRLQRDSLLTMLLVVLLMVPLVVVVARALSRALRLLAAEAAAIRRFRFDSRPPLRSFVREVDELSLAFEAMRGTIRHFLEISAVLAAEENVDRLLQRLLEESIAAARADGGALYLPAAEPGDGPVDGAADAPVAGAGDGERVPPLRARLLERRGQQLDPASLPGLDAAAAAALLAEAEPAAGGERIRGERLVLPLRDRRGDLQGVLLLWFSAPPEEERVAFCRSLSGSASVALETRGLLEARRRLFDGFIHLIADAIDAKSPYTGGHCARVPEITRLLAEAACDSREGPFASFALDAEGWEAIHVASWLHDCGKVTSPEHVVDKATKLETITDRIHEVRMRFELLKAEAACDHWRAIAAGADPAPAAEELQRRWAELDDDFAFVAACNHGGEALDPASVDRLQRIASRTWRRTLDDRLGISQEELRRREGQPAEPLPVREPLLADRPHHRFERPERSRLAADNPWGFRLEVPELLQNQGELHNLRVARGTLNPEERFWIQDHMIQTIRMLSALPFPRHLRQVPEIAGAHHETMDGRGYPRRLRGDQMSVPARIMAIADIFEALTAADRPYKSGKPLSEALAIMARMVRERHLDADLFALFLRSGVPQIYARRFLPPYQIDAVDVEALLEGS